MKRGTLGHRQFWRLGGIGTLAIGLVLAAAPFHTVRADPCTGVDFPRFQPTIDHQIKTLTETLGIAACYEAGHKGQDVTIAVWSPFLNEVRRDETSEGAKARTDQRYHDCLVGEIAHAIAPKAKIVVTDDPSSVNAQVVVASFADFAAVRNPNAPLVNDVNTLRQQGKLVVFAAGNHGQRVYQASFIDSDVDGIHEVTDHTEVLLPSQKTHAYIYWQDSSVQLELQMVDRHGLVVASSQPVQDWSYLLTRYPPDPPWVPGVEKIEFDPKGGKQKLRVHVKNGGAIGVPFEVIMVDGSLPPNLAATSENSVVHPPSLDALIVGATDPLATELLDFSSNGPTVDMVVPGGKIPLRGFGDVSDIAGTSFAAPIAAGMAAVLLSANRGLTSLGVEALLKNSASPLLDRHGNIVRGTGAGVPNLSAPCSRALSFSAAEYTTSEAEGQRMITVLRTGDPAASASVRYLSVDGTAKASKGDYVPVDGRLIFGPGEIEKAFAVVIARTDQTKEGDEFFTVTLSEPTGATLGTPMVAKVVIGGKPTLEFSQPEYSVGERDGSATIKVVRSKGDLDKTVSVHYGTTGGSATPGLDYEAQPQSKKLTFGPRVTEMTFTVPIILDTELNEGQETVNLLLSEPSLGARLGRKTAVLTIHDSTCDVSGTWSGRWDAGVWAASLIQSPAGVAGTFSFDTSVYTITSGSATCSNISLIGETSQTPGICGSCYGPPFCAPGGSSCMQIATISGSISGACMGGSYTVAWGGLWNACRD